MTRHAAYPHHRVLIIEDELDTADAIRNILTEEGYSAEVVTQGRRAVAFVKAWKPDIILLDLTLEDMPPYSGIAICREVREWSATVPIIVLTHAKEESLNIASFHAGADDYLTKPFNPELLLVHLERANTRLECLRHSDAPQRVNIDEHLTMDFAKYQILREGEAIHLTEKEYRVLEYMIRNVNRVLTHDMILERCWDESYVCEQGRNSLKVYIRRLREKIEPVPTSPQYITNIRNIGYMFRMKSSFTG